MIRNTPNELPIICIKASESPTPKHKQKAGRTQRVNQHLWRQKALVDIRTEKKQHPAFVPDSSISSLFCLLTDSNHFTPPHVATLLQENYSGPTACTS